MSPTLRRARFTDAEAISLLVASVYDRVFSSPDRAGAQAFLASVTPPAIAAMASAPNFHYLLVEEAGELLAAGALRDGRHVYHMWVRKSHQGRGLARMLWTALEAHGRASGNVGEFTVNASIDAIPVYAAFGFVPEGGRQESGGLVYQPMAIRLP